VIEAEIAGYDNPSNQPHGHLSARIHQKKYIGGEMVADTVEIIEAPLEGEELLET
jgi:hypothetical protein